MVTDKVIAATIATITCAPNGARWNARSHLQRAGALGHQLAKRARFFGALRAFLAFELAVVLARVGRRFFVACRLAKGNPSPSDQCVNPISVSAVSFRNLAKRGARAPPNPDSLRLARAT